MPGEILVWATVVALRLAGTLGGVVSVPDGLQATVPESRVAPSVVTKLYEAPPELRSSRNAPKWPESLFATRLSVATKL